MISGRNDHILHENDKVNIFGNGAILHQIKPLLFEWNITIHDVFDDDSINGSVLDQKKRKILYCVGYSDMEKRGRRFKTIQETHEMVSLIAKQTIVSGTAEIGSGVIVYQGAVIDNYSVIDNNVILNIGVKIAHNTHIGENVYISPGAVVCGNVEIQGDVFIGANATIIDGLTVGKGAVIAAGAVVIKDVVPYTMVAGCPAIIKKTLKEE